MEMNTKGIPGDCIRVNTSAGANAVWLLDFTFNPARLLKFAVHLWVNSTRLSLVL